MKKHTLQENYERLFGKESLNEGKYTEFPQQLEDTLHMEILKQIKKQIGQMGNVVEYMLADDFTTLTNKLKKIKSDVFKKYKNQKLHPIDKWLPFELKIMKKWLNPKEVGPGWDYGAKNSLGDEIQLFKEEGGPRNRFKYRYWMNILGEAEGDDYIRGDWISMTDTESKKSKKFTNFLKGASKRFTLK